MGDMNVSAISLINYIKETKMPLNRWEKGFVNSIERQISFGHVITPAQIKCLESIYARVTGAGRYQKRVYV